MGGKINKMYVGHQVTQQQKPAVFTLPMVLLATLFIKPIFSQGTPFMHRTDPVPNLSSWSTPPPRSKLRHTPDL